MPEPAVADRRPSPRPRPVDHPHLTVVPPPTDPALQPQPETETAHPADAPTVEFPQVSDHPDSANPAAGRVQVAGFGASLRAATARTRHYWTPPALFTTQPPTLAALADYARAAPWTTQRTGPARTVGVGYYRWCACPATVACRYWEWVWQRPGRLAAHLGVIKLVSLTGPGGWAVDQIITPAARLAGHLFL